jgi:hypothetical protein
MGTSSWLATWLDWRSLTQLGTSVEPEGRLPSSLPVRAGGDVADEFGGRLLLRYVTDAQLGTFRLGSADACYATPTPYTPEEASRWLVLPAPQILRRHVLLLDPRQIETIQGPQWGAESSTFSLTASRPRQSSFLGPWIASGKSPLHEPA